VPPLDRLERLTDLVLVLLGAQRPITLGQIAQEVPGYPASRDACRQAFERDKRLLRAEGIPILTEAVEGPEQFGYRIDPEAFYLPDLELTPDEQAALHLAVAGVHLGDPSGRDALLKLGAVGLAEARPVAALDPPPALVPLFEALGRRAEVAFTYRGAGRRVAPAGLAFRRGRWYLGAWDLDRQATRTFRVDRIEDVPTRGPDGSGVPPEGVDPADARPAEPWQLPEGDEQTVEVLVDPVEAPRVTEEVGDRAVVERRLDGSVVIGLAVTNERAFVTWVLGLGHHAEVLAPEPVRRAVVEWLEALAAGRPESVPGRRGGADGPAGPDSTSPPGPRPADAVTPAAPGGEDPGGAPGRRGLPSTPPASERLRRLLAMVGWLARVGEASIDELAARFGLAPGDVVAELELAACCGVPPYSPDALMEILVTEDRVQARLPAELARPRRLTAAEGFALAATARTILAVPGADADGALARALARLEEVLGEPGRLVVELDEPRWLPDARQALAADRQVEIEYHSASTDETTRRVVDPVAVVAVDGHWYLDGWCHRAGDLRRFRVDRIRRLSEVGPRDPAAAALDPAAAGPFVPGPGARTVRLAVGPEAAWLAETVPVLATEPTEDGGQVLTLGVAGRAWFDRLLLQLGPAARVLEPEDLVPAAAEAARRVLARYRR
jgi:proteasome accessory factor C